jgi:integrase
LLLTGRRKSEVLELRWSDLDLEAGSMSLAATKTGAKRFLLSPGVVDLLRDAKARQQDDVRAGEEKGQPTAKQVSTEFVVRGHIAGQRLVNIQKPWDRIRARAALDDVRIHDLRHTYASQAAGRGLTLAEIGKLLGQTQLSTTQRYAHLFDDAERRAVSGLDEHFGNLVAAAGH